MSSMSYEDLVQLNNAQKTARYVNGQQKLTLREELEKALQSYKGKITELPGVRYKPRMPSQVFDTSNEYCGNLKAYRIRQWLADGGYNNRRRKRLAEVTSLSLVRINNIALFDGRSIITNAEYAQIKAAMPKIEAMEGEVETKQQVAS